MRSKKALFNIISSLGYEVVALICGLITPRLILSTFGSDYNGVVSSITQFLSMISILRMGVAGSTRVALYKTLANNDREGTSRIVRATELFMQKISWIFIAYALVLGFIYPLISHNDVSYWGNFTLVLIIGIGTFSQYCFGFSYNCLLTADQRNYIYNILHIVAIILNTVIAFILIKAGATIYIVKLGSVICYAALPVVLSLYVRVRYKINRKVLPDNNALTQRKSAMFHSVANMVHQKSGMLIMTISVTATNISIYNVYNLVVGNLRLVMQSFTNGLEAAFGSMWAKRETERFCHSFSIYEFVMNSVVSVVFSCAALLLVPFVMLYTSGITDADYYQLGFAILFVVSEALYCIREPYVTIVQAAGKYKETKWAAMTEAIIIVVVSLSLVWFIGIHAIVIGAIAANFYRIIAYSTFISKQVIPAPLYKTFLRMIWTAANVLMTVFLFTRFVEISEIDSWGKWIGCGFAIFGISSIITVLSSLLFYRRNLFGAVRFVKKMFQKRKNKKEESTDGKKV